MENQGGPGPKIAPRRPNLMIFGPIASFRRSGSRFSGQKGPRSSEMRVYIEIIGYVKNHQKFKILFWSRESEKPIFTIFPEFFYEKWAGYGISSETPWSLDLPTLKHAVNMPRACPEHSYMIPEHPRIDPTWTPIRPVTIHCFI